MRDCVVILGPNRYLHEWAAALDAPTIFIGTRRHLASLPEPAQRKPETRLEIDSYTNQPSQDLVERLSEYRIGGVVAGKEEVVSLAGELRTALTLPGLSKEQALACRNKGLQRNAWRVAGIPVPKYRVIDREPDGISRPVAAWMDGNELGFPVVVKPIDGSGSMGVTVVRDCSDLASVDDGSFAQVICEEFAEGSEWHIDGAITNGRLAFASCSQYIDPVIQTKIGRPVRSIQKCVLTHSQGSRLGLFAERCCRALGVVDGVIHLELFDHEGVLTAGELAARPGGGQIVPTVLYSTGVNLWSIHGNLSAGLPPNIGVVRDPDFVWGFMHLPSVDGVLNPLNKKMIEDREYVVAALERVQPGAMLSSMSQSSSAGPAHVIMKARTEEELIVAFGALSSWTESVLGIGGD